MKTERAGLRPGWTVVAGLLVVVGCGTGATDEAERGGATPAAPDPVPMSAVARAAPPTATASPAPPPVTVGAACSPDPAAARGTAVAGYHCDDLRDPAHPVWRAGPPSLGWFDVTTVAAERRARPDDDACDEEGIQAAVDAACAAGGGVVFVPPGRYLICRRASAARAADWGVEVACDDVHLRGAGVGATTFVGEPAVQATNARTMFRFADAERVSMARCTIDGSYDGDRKGWGNGIRALGVQNGTFVDMRITDHFNHNIALRPSPASGRASDDNLLARLVTERGRQTNIIVYSAGKEAGDVKNRRNRIVECSATGAQKFFGLEVRYSDDTEILGGLYANNENSGINIEEAAYGTRIVGAVMRDNGGSGLAIWGRPARVRGTVCEDCVMEGNAANGVRNLAGDDTVLRRCRISGNGRNGYVDAQSDDDPPPGRTRFEQCELVGNTGFGVLARGPGHVMSGGTVRDNGSGQGRAGIRTLGPAEGLEVEGTRFADGGS